MSLQLSHSKSAASGKDGDDCGAQVPDQDLQPILKHLYSVLYSASHYSLKPRRQVC